MDASSTPTFAPMNSEKQIAILGAGLVGSLLAVILAKRGYNVAVFERRGDMRKEKVEAGRSINLALSERGWKGLRTAGLDEEIRRVAIPMKGRMIHAEDGTMNLQQYGKDTEAIWSVSRGGLNQELISLAEKNSGVGFHFYKKAESVDLESNRIFFEGEKEPQHFDLIFGADGAFSALRKSFLRNDRFDYAQQYIGHGYKELSIPAGKSGEHRLEKNALHIWPRGNFMLIALPNIDGSFTCTLFFPFEGEVSFASIKNENDWMQFCTKYFPDAAALMPSLREDYLRNPVSSLHTVKCFPWTHGGRNCLIGDAAHAIVPFFGQGMNAGFEDCTMLNELMDEYVVGDNTNNGDWKKILTHFENSRKPNTDAIADLALTNFIEMRDLVADAHFLKKKKIEKLVAAAYPAYLSLYAMVSFSHIPYAEALRRGRLQNALLEKLAALPDAELDVKAAWVAAAVAEIGFGV